MLKEEIIAALSALPNDKLELLYEYSKNVIIPDADLLTRVNMISMKAKVNEFADKNFSEWTDRSTTDFGMFLAEIMCVMSEKDFWYINGFFTQSVMQRMTTYSLAWLRASEMGYRPSVFIGSTGTFQLTYLAGSSHTYSKGELIVVANELKFTNVSTFTVGTGAESPVVTLRQGSYYTDNITFNGYSLDIRRAGVNVDTLEVTVGDTTYTRVYTFGDSGSAPTQITT